MMNSRKWELIEREGSILELSVTNTMSADKTQPSQVKKSLRAIMWMLWSIVSSFCDSVGTDSTKSFWDLNEKPKQVERKGSSIGHFDMHAVVSSMYSVFQRCYG